MATSAMELRVLINILQDGTALKGLLADTKAVAAALSDLQTKSKAGDNAANAIKKVGDSGRDAAKGIKQLNDTVEKATSALKFLAGGFLALESVRFVKDIADTAARAEVLGTVLHVVGNNAGYSTAALDAMDRQVQALGITAAASRQALTQFLEAQLPLEKAGQLARAAQDAAVILNTNSSEAFSRLVTAVQTSNTQMLRHMGIIVMADISYQKFATSIGKTVGSLTQVERSQAFLNATLEQTAKIQGSYTAAMGDVGKQLTSLDRLTNDLKTSLGNNLLPAYLAIVQQLTYFLEDEKLVSDGMYHQGENAKLLGDYVHYAAAAIKDFVELLISYRREVFAVIAAYGGLKIIAWLVENGMALARTFELIGAAAEGAAVGGVAGLVGLVGGWPVAIGVLITALLAWAATFPKVRAAAKVDFDIIATAFVTMRDTLKLFTDDLRDSSSWKEWVEHAKAAIADVKSWIEQGKKDWEEYKKIANPTPEDRETKRQQTLQELAQAMYAVRVQQDQLAVAQKGTSAQAITDANKELETLKDKERQIRKNLGAQEDASKMSQGERDKEAADLEVKIGVLKDNQVKIQVQEAQKGRQFTYSDDQKIGTQFGTAQTQTAILTDAYLKLGEASNTSTKEIITNFEETAKHIKFSDELSQLDGLAARVSNIPGLTKDQLERMRIATTTAGRQIIQERIRETATLDGITQKQFDTQAKITEDSIARELSMLKDGDKLKSIAQQQDFDAGLTRINQYYDDRRAISRAENVEEIKQATAAFKKIDDEIRKLNVRRTPEQLADLKVQRDEAADKISALRRGQTTTEAEDDVKRTKALTDHARELYALELEIAAARGGEAEAVDVINNKYEVLIANTADAQEKTALADKQKLEVDAKHQEYLDKAYQYQVGALKALQTELDLKKEVRDVEAAQDKARNAQGAISDRTLQIRENARLRQDMADNREKVAAEQQSLANQREELARQINQIQARVTDSPVERARQIAEVTQQAQVGIDQTTSSIQKLETAYAGMSATIAQASKQVADSITNSISGALTSMIVDFKNAGDTLKSLSRSIASEIVGIFTKAVAQAIVKTLGLQSLVNRMMGLASGGGFSPVSVGDVGGGGSTVNAAEGGVISGPGTGTSDSIHAMVSTGEHIMPAAKTAQWLPVLEGIRLGRILPHYALGGVVALQSIAMAPVIPRRYAGGGVVTSDAGAASVTPGGGGPSAMMVTLHPDTMNMSMREWLEHEVARQQGRR